jgi:hypothetical protein
MGLMTDDDRFHQQLQRLITELEPPPAPRDAMWTRIQAERAARRAAAAPEAGVVPFRRRVVGPTFAWIAALAATLVIGIGLGRISLRQTTTVATPAPAPANTADAVPTPYRLVANEHFQRTETLLTALSVDAGTTGAAEFSTWARALLTETRLLLASPVAQDRDLLRLLEDLELVLAQICAIPVARAKEEVELIQDGINQSDVLLRLRAATANRRSAGT